MRDPVVMKLRMGALFILTVLVAGCGGGSDEPADEPSTEPTATQTSAAAAGDTECLLGRWYLDTDDYASQAKAYVVGLGVPMESLAISGNQILDFNESPYMSLSTDLQLDAVVQGQPLSVSSQNAGGGEWGWDGESDSEIGVDNWDWTAESSDSPDGAPPLIDPSQGVSVTCTDSRLTVQGAGAPLVGVFVRR